MEFHLVVYLVLGLVVLHSTKTTECKQTVASLACNQANAAKLLLGLLKTQNKVDDQIQNDQQVIAQEEDEEESPPELNDKRFGEKKAPSVTSWQLYSLKRRRPWLLLPNERCYRHHCKSSKDCCRHHNICDRSANVCYDCWYGYPCRSSADCCMRYPRCISAGMGKQGRCSN